MSFHVIRPMAAVALVLSVGLVALPACKKTKPTVPDSPTPAPTPNPNPTPNPGPSVGDALPPAPKGPIFRGATPLGRGVREAAEANMKQIVLAIREFEVVYGALPAGYADKTGKPGLSWRVAILPYLEQDNLLKQFKLDEPWDSAHNKALLSKFPMPKQFAPPSQDTRGYTFARGFTGPGTWLPDQTQAGTPGQLLLGVKFAQITDGLSNTVLVTDAAEAVIWTRPDEMRFTPNNVPKLGGVFESGTSMGLADGSVKFVSKSSGLKIADVIQIADGNPVQFDN